MSISDEHNFDEQHFDEVDAVRRFPNEDEWLDLPAPDPGNDAETAKPDAPMSFTDRVMRARHDEQALDSQLTELETALPTEWLQQFAAPTPSGSFVDDTVATVMNDRRNRWQQMLSRYVAPEPSPAFVSRTIDALRDGDALRDDALRDGALRYGALRYGEASSANRRSAARHAAETAASSAQLPYTPIHGSRSNWPVFSLVAAAAAAIFWLLLTDVARAPLQVRLADQTSPAVAYGEATTPMSAILARVANDEEPFAVFDAPADGLWLVSTTGELR